MEDLEKQFQKALRDFSNKNFKLTQKAIKETADEFKKTIVANSPVDSGNFKGSWRRKDYPNASYLWNGPLTNIIEYSARGPRPFIRDTFNRSKKDIEKTLITKIQQKLRRIK